MPIQRIEYAGSVHDEEEIEAVVSVLRGGATALRIGKHTKEMERLVAEAFGKRRGIMVNSGSSALYLAVELLGLEPGEEILTPALTFSTDIASILRANLVPVLVDVTEDSYQIDVDQIESAIGPKTKAILAPNLIGNCPNWDDIRAIADRHGLQVVEDSCDCLGATLDGTPTGKLYNPFLDPMQPNSGCNAIHTGQVYVDSMPLPEIDLPELHKCGTNKYKPPACFSVNVSARTLHARWPKQYNGTMPPSVEVTVRSRVFAPHKRGLQYIVVQGFIIEKAANRKCWLPFCDDIIWLAHQASPSVTHLAI